MPQATPLPPSRAWRNALHAAALLLAFPLTWLADPQHVKLGWAYAAALCFILALLAFFVLDPLAERLLGRRVSTPEEGKWGGPVWYPLGLGAAFLILPAWAVGAAWAALAAGDAAAAALGRSFPRPALPWNKSKSWTGTAAFIVASTPAACLLLQWCSCPLFRHTDGRPEWQYVWTLAVLTAVAGAILESLDVPGNDNPRIVLGTGLAVWLFAALLSAATRQMPQARAFQPEWLLHALAINAVLAVLVWRIKFVSLAGAIGGGVAGAAVYFLALPSGYALLLVFVVAGSLLSRLGRATKEARHAAEADGGRRRLANVAANLGVPVLACLAYSATRGEPAALLAFAGALCAAFADTASAELGTLAPREPRLITTGQRVPHGTDGAVSWLGYGGALAACVLLAAVAWAGGFWRIVVNGHEVSAPHVTVPVGLLLSAVLVAAGLIGTTVDSLLGATIEPHLGRAGKHVVNFFCTLSGAAVGALAGLALV